MGVSPFKDPDIKFLAKFVQCMQPITDSLDRLQGDKQCYMADVIPTFLRTKKKLEIISQKTLAHCHPLCRGLLQSLNKRFGEYLCLSDNVSEYIVASTAHPFFKLRWVPSDHVGHVRDLFLTKAAAENDTLGDEAALILPVQILMISSHSMMIPLLNPLPIQQIWNVFNIWRTKHTHLTVYTNILLSKLCLSSIMQRYPHPHLLNVSFHMRGW